MACSKCGNKTVSSTKTAQGIQKELMTKSAGTTTKQTVAGKTFVKK